MQIQAQDRMQVAARYDLETAGETATSQPEVGVLIDPLRTGIGDLGPDQCRCQQLPEKPARPRNGGLFIYTVAGESQSVPPQKAEQGIGTP